MLDLDLAFGRDKRLLTGKAFQAVFDNNACRVSHPNLLLLAKPNSLGHARLGMVVAKKNIRRAVDRNRVKRVVRETFRHAQQSLGGVDIIFLSRRGLADISPLEQTELLQQSWKKIERKLAQRQVTQ